MLSSSSALLARRSASFSASAVCSVQPAATLAIRTHVPLAVMEDVIQPFPTFSEVFLHALLELTARHPAAA